MFKVEFCCNSFHGELAWMEQDYTVPDGVEVVEVDRFVGHSMRAFTTRLPVLVSSQ
jgi:hypothetical protein